MTSATAHNAELTDKHAPSVSLRHPAEWLRRLAAAFRRHEVRNGYHHPAEIIIDDILRNGTPEDHRQLEQSAVNAADPITAFGILHTLPQVDPPWDDQRKAHLVALALSAPDVTIRDAGIRAAERWPSREALAKIEMHKDPDRKLADYANAVAYDIRECLGLLGA